jgi:hypothetical protein
VAVLEKVGGSIDEGGSGAPRQTFQIGNHERRRICYVRIEKSTLAELVAAS